MNPEQIPKQVMGNSMTLAKLEEGLKATNKRIDENDKLTNGIYDLTASVKVLIQQVGSLTESVKRQGERIGALESKAFVRPEIFDSRMAALSERVDKGMASLESKLDERLKKLEEKPAKRWEAVAGQVIQLIVAAVFGAVIAGLI